MKTLMLSIIAISGIAMVGTIALVLTSEINATKLIPQDNETENAYRSSTLRINNKSEINADKNQTYYHNVIPNDIVVSSRYGQTTTLWNYPTDDPVYSVTISSDGKYIVAGSESDQNRGSVYFLDNQGNLLWQHQTDRKIGHVSLSSDGSYVLASGYQIAPGPAGIYENGAIYFFDRNGKMLWNYITNDYGKILVDSLSPDGSHVAIASGTQLAYLGNNGKSIWNYTSRSDVFSISISSDNSVVISAGNQVQYFNKKGNLLWTFDTGYGYSQARVSANGKYVIATDAPSGYAGKIYFIDNKGNLIKEDQVGSPVLSLSMSDDCQRVAIGTNWATMVFNSTGGLMWNDKIPSQVAISSNGSFLAAISGAGGGTYLTYYDDAGNILSRYPIGGWGQILLSKDSQYVVLGYPTGYSAGIQFLKVPKIYAEGLGISDVPRFNLQGMQVSNDTHVMISSKNNTELHAQVATGQTIQLPYNLNFETNYTSPDLQLGINSSSYIEATISQVFPTETINGIPPGNNLITIHVDPHAIPGDYTLVVNGTGRTEDSITGWMTTLDNVALAKVHITIKPYSSSISINVGPTDYKMRSFCVNNEHGGQFCSTGPIYGEIPITVYSNYTQTVKLDALNIEPGEWVKFNPGQIVARPNGTTLKMTVAGYEVSVMKNRSSDKSLIISASSEHDNTTTVLPVVQGKISVLHTTSPIQLDKITTNSNGINFGISGVVYDPMDNSSGTLPVKLSVLGIMSGNNTTLLPSWLSVDIQDSSFTLNSTQPYYFMTIVKTSNAPNSGVYTIAMDENIGNKHFIQPEEITIENVRH